MKHPTKFHVDMFGGNRADICGRTDRQTL